MPTPGLSESSKLGERGQLWRAEVARLLSQAQQLRREEGQPLGSAQPADRLPDELANAQEAAAPAATMKAEVEQEAQAQ